MEPAPHLTSPDAAPVITRARLIRAAIFVGSAAAVAFIIWTIVANFDSGPAYGTLRRREERSFSLGVLALGFAGLLAVPGAAVTIAFLRWRYPWLRRLYYTVLFLLVVALVLNLAAGAPYLFWGFCWSCDWETWWVLTIVPASIFVAIAPLVWALVGPWFQANV